ncbi:MAG TPA: RNA polymerase factor sigma-54 [bacterium]|nr:RNA polymerase factor sigma-54 [bacterium]
MALEIKQNLKLSQSLVITPQLQQAIKLLQLSQMELVEMVQNEMLENPLLEEGMELEEPSKESPEAQAERQEMEVQPDSAPQVESQEVGGKEGDFKQEAPDFDWDNYLNTYNAPENVQSHIDELPSYENTLASKTSLFDHLMWQLQLSNLSPEENNIGTMILGCINDDGYLQDPLEDVAAKCEASPEAVEAVLRKIQEFDPPGVGARNLKECLMVQVRHLGPEKDLVARIIDTHLANLERKDYLRIAKDLKISLEKVQDLARIIQELEPKPGREYSTSDPQYITPDVYVNKIGNEWVVVLNEDGLPKLKVSSLYKSMMDGNGASATKEYVQNKLRSAIWLIRSIHQRQRTLYRTSKTIVKFQQEFFEKGISALRPMILRDVANEIEMHESTVSRVTTNKYMHTPHGIFELKYFFNSGITTSDGDSIASETIKTKIKNLIGQENPKKPLSDQDIVQLLKDGNIDIARRTVAKYRELMGIQPSSKRRQLY